MSQNTGNDGILRFMRFSVGKTPRVPSVVDRQEDEDEDEDEAAAIWREVGHSPFVGRYKPTPFLRVPPTTRKQ